MNEISHWWLEGLKNNLNLRGDSPWINNVNTKRQPFIEVFVCVGTMRGQSERPSAFGTECCQCTQLKRPQVTFVLETD